MMPQIMTHSCPVTLPCHASTVVFPSDLFDLHLFDLHAQVKDHFANPVVPEDDKREMLEKLSKDADFSQHTQSFLGLLVQVLPPAVALERCDATNAMPLVPVYLWQPACSLAMSADACHQRSQAKAPGYKPFNYIG